MLIVIQVMFGMGTQMSLKDFTGVAKAPRGMAVGIVCHFSACRSWVSGSRKCFTSNPDRRRHHSDWFVLQRTGVQRGLHREINLVLSVTVTAITTMFAPLLTPLLMKWLAGSLVPVSYFKMMMEIIKFVIVDQRGAVA
jgi:BASS family bile acid:Na+ symporter